MLHLRNPHSVIAALEARPDAVARLELPAKGGGPAWQRARDLAQRLHRPVTPLEEPERSGGSSRREDRSGRRDRGPVAHIEERPPVDLDALYAGADSGSGLWLALDSLQDPQNVGAVFRTAAFFGVRGILMTRDRAAPMSAVVYDVASGGVEAVPFAVETNLRRALEAARDAGLWLVGSSEHADRDVYTLPRDRPWLLVVGNEERGLRPRTLDACDDTVRVAPHEGAAVTSLNVASATAVLIGALSRPPDA